jgi:hypothetical protein
VVTTLFGLPYLGSGRWLSGTEISVAQNPVFIQKEDGQRLWER